MKSDGTNRTEFAPAAVLGSPVGLALDWLTENLYYTNPATQSIEVRQIIVCPVLFLFVLLCFFYSNYWLHMALFQSVFYLLSLELQLQKLNIKCNQQCVRANVCRIINASVCVCARSGFEVERGGTVPENSNYK